MDGLLIPLSLVLITNVLSFAAAIYWSNRKTRQDAAAGVAVSASLTDDRILELERQIAALQANVLPISAAFQAVLIKQLTHFHTPVLDALLVRLGSSTPLTDEEGQQLTTELEKRAIDLNGKIDESEREAAIMLPLVMKRVKAEQDEEGKLQMVVVPPPHE